MNGYPASVQALLTQLAEGFRQALTENLVGIYLHGSLTLGGFNPRTSDVDFLIVTRASLRAAERTALIALTLELAQNAPSKGLEFSIVTLTHTLNFTHPCPFEFHYGLNWHERFVSGEVDYGADPRDPDLAAHFTITRARGHCLHGAPINQVFGAVPERYYWDSIRADAEDILRSIRYNPVYSILNLCRVLAYQQDKLIVSKVEGAAWALTHLPPLYHPLIQQAVNAYQSPVELPGQWDDGEIHAFGEYARSIVFP